LRGLNHPREETVRGEETEAGKDAEAEEEEEEEEGTRSKFSRAFV